MIPNSRSRSRAWAFSVGEPIRVRRGVVHHLREDHRPRRRQRAPCPPQMQGARMPVPDGLLAHAGGVDRVQRQGDFDEFLAVLHAVSRVVRSISGGIIRYGGSSERRIRREPALKKPFQSEERRVPATPCTYPACKLRARGRSNSADIVASICPSATTHTRSIIPGPRSRAGGQGPRYPANPAGGGERSPRRCPYRPSRYGQNTASDRRWRDGRCLGNG